MSVAFSVVLGKEVKSAFAANDDGAPAKEHIA
jgi:hypothetical protein